MASPQTTNAAVRPSLRLLMLHGFTQSGNLFSQKTGALKKCIVKAFPSYNVSFSFPTAPHRLHPADVPGFVPNSEGPTNDHADKEKLDCWAWFQRSGKEEPCTYNGFNEGLDFLAQVINDEGPFDGVIGFSQGGFMATSIASLMESGRPEAFANAEVRGGMPYPQKLLSLRQSGMQPPFQFAVSYSGFAATQHSLYQALYEPKISTPVLHFLGSVDTVVSEERSMRLVDSCDNITSERGRRLVYHPGGHFVPASQKQYQRALIDFMTEILAANGKNVTLSKKSLPGDHKTDERVEDMELPF